MTSQTPRSAPSILLWAWTLAVSTAASAAGLVAFYALDASYGLGMRALIMLGIAVPSVVVLGMLPRVVRASRSRRSRASSGFDL